MTGPDALVVGRQRQPLSQQCVAFFLGIREMLRQQRRVGVFEVEGTVLTFCTQEHVAVPHTCAVEVQVEDVVDVLHIHREPFQPICHLEAGQSDRDAANLLEVGELPHLHTVAPHLPTQSPGAESGAFPIVFDKAKVMQQRVEAEFTIAAEKQLLRILGRRLHDHLVLVVVLQPVWVLAIAAISRPPTGLYVSGTPRLRSERP